MQRQPTSSRGSCTQASDPCPSPCLKLWSGSPAYACAAGGERYLDTAEGDLYWFHLHLLDVYAFVTAAVLCTLSAVAWLLWSLLRWALRQPSSKAKTA